MKYSTSVNIERDSDKAFNYIVTANAKQAIGKIVDFFTAGIHSFCLIGSYGTGKSSFLLALEQCLSAKQPTANQLIKNKGQFNGFTKFRFVNIVGDYQPLIELLQAHVETATSKKNNVFAAIDKLYNDCQKDNSFLVFVIDEFGKVLEHAAKNNPEKEMYFLQKFCEYVNDTSKNILLLTTLHQGFNAYAKDLKLEQKQEWTKVKGRIQDIVFKEPIEQLLNLAATKIAAKREATNNTAIHQLYDLALKSKFANDNLKPDVVSALYPMDIFAAYTLTQANQRYGQNERTLFSFLEATGEDSIAQFSASENTLYNLVNVYDYVQYNFHSSLSEVNADSTNWSAIKIAIERVEGLPLEETEIEKAIGLVKVIGLLNIFASSSARIDSDFLAQYARLSMGINDIEPLMGKLEKSQIIRFAKYKSKYILFEGTDVDIEMGLYNASLECKRTDDYIDKLKRLFTFRISIANAHYYRTGTPRYFEYQITDTPITKMHQGEIDGIIDLIFAKVNDYSVITNDCLSQKGIAVTYCIFKNAQEIIDHIFEIDKLEWVRKYYIEDENDKVANKEIENLIEYEKSLLNRCVTDSLFSDDVQWVFNGECVDSIHSQKDLMKFLSIISDTIYSATPVFKNELINKHRPSGTMSVARQNYLNALLENRDKEDIGFSKEKYPPEKSIYLTMLKSTGIHSSENDSFGFSEPTEPSFLPLWECCMDFLKSAQQKRRKIGELASILSEPPYGIKQGFIECWLPSFLIIKKDDFALYSGDAYIPSINKEVLDLLYRNPNSLSVKSFCVEGIKQEFFDKYREAVNLKKTDLNGNSFIETIRPFLTFYKRLNTYAQTTKDISSEAKKFRDVIARATDPEATFFEQLPEALGFREVVLTQNPEAIESFVTVLHNAIRNLRSCYEEYVKSIEQHILKALKIKETDYLSYKPIIDKRYESVKTALMPNDVKNFHSRLTGNYDNRTTWIESVCYAVLNKPLEKIKDAEKAFLLTSLQDKLFQLDDYVEMHKTDSESIVRLHITQNKEGAITKQVVVPQESLQEVSLLEKKLEDLLSKDNTVNVAALINLIKKKLQ